MGMRVRTATEVAMEEMSKRLARAMEEHYKRMVAKVLSEPPMAATTSSPATANPVAPPPTLGRTHGDWAEDLDHGMCVGCGRVYGPQGDCVIATIKAFMSGVNVDGTLRGVFCTAGGCQGIGKGFMKHPWANTTPCTVTKWWWSGHVQGGNVKAGYGCNLFMTTPPTDYPHEWQGGAVNPTPSPYLFPPLTTAPPPKAHMDEPKVKLRSGSPKGRCCALEPLKEPIHGIKWACCSLRKDHEDEHEAREGHMDGGLVLMRWGG